MPVNLEPSSPTIERLICKAVEQVVAETIDKECAAVADRVDKKVRGEVGNIAARVLHKFHMERFGNTLRIEVKFEGGAQ
jgi:hypothetical protein